MVNQYNSKLEEETQFGNSGILSIFNCSRLLNRFVSSCRFLDQGRLSSLFLLTKTNSQQNKHQLNSHPPTNSYPKMMAIQQTRSTLSFLVLFALLFISKASAGFYDDWWLCVDNCCETCADCVDSCTDDFNSSHSTEGKDVPASSFAVKKRSRTSLRKSFSTKLTLIGDFINCPPGTVPTAFPMPIYDEEGLFVIGYETVWFCIDEDLEPQG